MLTPDEYMAIMRLISSERESEGASLSDRNDDAAAKKSSRGKNPNLKKALTEANSRMRLKSGKLRKGKTQGDVMRLAHKILKKMK